MTQPRQGALARQLERYYVRFNDAFWDFFAKDVQPLIPADATIVDLGSGPGLFLRDVRDRMPNARLIGVDYADDMLSHSDELRFNGERAEFKKGDVSKDLPLDDGSVDLVAIAAVMHTFDDPFTFLDEVRRVLAPNGVFLLYDWSRVSFKDYIDYRQREPGDPEPARYPRALELFATHNKYTPEDWRWIFDKSHFTILNETWPYPRAIALLTKPDQEVPG